MEKTEEKIYGIYNTLKNPEAFNSCDEIYIWKYIDRLEAALYWARRGNNASTEDLIESQYNLEYVIYSTRRFGVEFNKEPSSTEYVERSPSYKAWFTFWYNHFNSMPREIRYQFIKDRTNGKDISKYMPSGNWKDSLVEAPKKVR